MKLFNPRNSRVVSSKGFLGSWQVISRYIPKALIDCIIQSILVDNLVVLNEIAPTSCHLVNVKRHRVLPFLSLRREPEA